MSNFWILDTTCSSHICKSLWRLQGIKSLKNDDFKLYGVGGETLHAEAIEIYLLKLHSKKDLRIRKLLLYA